jgi:hypothetical protein
MGEENRQLEQIHFNTRSLLSEISQGLAVVKATVFYLQGAHPQEKIVN